MPFPDIEPDDENDAPPFPLAVRVAGVIWVIFGLSGTLTMAVLAWVVRFPIVVAVFLGVAQHLVAVEGVQVIRGRVRDVLDAAVRSLMGAFAFLAFSALPLMTPRPLPPAEIASAVAGAAGGIALLSASALALVGRMPYLRWRIENGYPEP